MIYIVYNTLRLYAPEIHIRFLGMELPPLFLRQLLIGIPSGDFSQISGRGTAQLQLLSTNCYQLQW